MRILAIIAAAVLLQSLPLDAKENSERIFDGRTLHGWTTLDGRPITEKWEVVDGMIHLKPIGKGRSSIVTAREFGDMDLTFEWKIAPGANNGLKYRVRQYNDGRTLGCEYQILDDEKYANSITLRQSSGALYGLYEPNRDKRLRPCGEFNSARIVIRGNRVEHWMNQQLIVTATIGSDEWKSRVAESKFSDIKDFALNPRGKLMLTDHGGEVWYRKLELHLAKGQAAKSR